MNYPVNPFPQHLLIVFVDGGFILGCLFQFFSLSGKRATFCSVPMELQSMTEDKDNGVWPITISLGAATAEAAMVSF